MITLVKKLLSRSVLPMGFLGDGMVWGTYFTSRSLEGSLTNAQKLHADLLEIGREGGVQAIALAGRLPSVLGRHGLDLSSPFVTGERGTTHAISEGVKKAIIQHRLTNSTTIAILGGGGRIGKRLLCRLQEMGFTSVLAIDHRFQQSSSTKRDVLVDTAESQRVQEADVVVVLTAEGTQIEEYLPYLYKKVIIDDTHPQLPHWIVEQLTQQQNRTYKLALAVDGFTFSPRLPGYRKGWIPGCVWEALVSAYALEHNDAIDTDEHFARVAERIPHQILLADHFDNKRLSTESDV
jgi:hypothetical protein